MKTALKFATLFVGTAILVSIFYFFLIGEWGVGLFLLVFLAVLLLPFIKREQNKKFDIIRFIVLSLLLIHILGIIWFYKIWFFDSVVHFLWGLLLGVVVLLILRKKTKLNRFSLGIITLIIVLLLGIGWEFIEFFWDTFFEQYSQYPRAQADLADTISDLISDVLGALVSVVVMLKPKV